MLTVRRGWRRRGGLMEKVDRSHHAIGNSPLPATVSADFLLEECVHGPFDFVEKIFRKQESQFVGIRNVFTLIKTPRAKLMSGRRCPFVMQNIAGSDFVFGENCGVQGNLVPIRESIAAFDTKGRVLGVAIVMLHVIFKGDVETVR